jgi:uncharacterized protein YdhG (YjbR/CyaY superfamily)
MEPTSKKFKTVDEYFSTFPKNVKDVLAELRKTVKQAAPQAEEVISYNMPAFKFKGILVYYAAYKKHIGFYPTSSGIEAFKKELSGYKWAKGSIQFPLDQPLPIELITNIVKFKVMRNSEKAAAKTKKK